jgi:hypothetical protein
MREDRQPKVIRQLNREAAESPDGAYVPGTGRTVGVERDNEVDEAVSTAFRRELKWDGSPDHMWTRIQEELGVRRKVRGRMALIATYATLAVSVVLLFLLARFQLETHDIYLVPSSMSADITAETDEVLPGGLLPISLRVSVRNGSVRISDMAVQLASKGVRAFTVLSETPVMRCLWGKNISEGDDFTEDCLITAPTEPGWYFLQVKAPTEDGQPYCVSSYFGFLVKYPEGGTHQGELAVEQEVQSDGRTLTVHSVTMTDRATEVRYSLSDEKQVVAHAVSLAAKDREPLVLLERQERVAPGTVSGVAVFEPTPSTVQTLSFEVAYADPSGSRSSQRPLKLEIPLPVKGQ